MTRPFAEPDRHPQDARGGAALPEGYVRARGVVGRGMVGRWVKRGQAESSEGLPLVARVLASRGLIGASEAREFMNPSLTMLHDPSLLPDADRAAERLLDAARAGEAIVIYGDYDVDGISATAILFHTLRHLVPGCRLTTYVPHRLEEGYGLNAEAIRGLAAEGARVIVSVDCGITATGPARAARACGVDLIVTDHHTPPTEECDLPEAFAVVHPRRHGSAYPFADLSGSAVAFKVAWRLATLACGSARVPAATRDVLLDMLAFASLGVIADVVPLRGENRVIARFGLSRLRHVANTGLRALIAASGLDGESVGEFDVGFKLGPRLNACGRLGHAKEAVELLTVASVGRAAEIAGQLSALNTERRGVEKRIAEQAADMARACGMDGPDRRAIVLAHEEWHAGVVGIACSRLVGLFHRPTILMHRDPETGECHGSGRSIDGFNLHAALEACKAHLIGFGGHDMAAGVRVRAENLGAFVGAFIAHANERLASEDLLGSIPFDTTAGLDELSVDMVRELEGLAPFGRENPSPRLLLRGLRVEGRPRVIGKTGEHASLFVKAPPGRASVQFPRSLRLVGWGWAERLSDMPVGAMIDAVVEPKVSAWNGAVNVEGEIVDVRVEGQGS